MRFIDSYNISIIFPKWQTDGSSSIHSMQGKGNEIAYDIIWRNSIESSGRLD